MNLHWLRDKEIQKCFRLFWEKGSKNKGEKHHPTIHQISQRGIYVRDALSMLSNNIASVYNKEL